MVQHRAKVTQSVQRQARRIDGLNQTGLDRGHPGWQMECPAMGLADQKMTAKIMLDRPDNFNRMAAKGVKRVGNHRVKSQTPGIMSLLPMKVAAVGASSLR